MPARLAHSERQLDYLCNAGCETDLARPSSDAVQRFLREYADQLADQRLVVFALDALISLMQPK